MNTGHQTMPKASAVARDRIFTPRQPLQAPAATYTISARGKPSDTPVFLYLRQQYGNMQFREVDSLFGFVERSELYGGRAFRQRELSDTDVGQLYSAGIGVRLPLSNHSVDRKEYERNLPLLDKYHRLGNTVIVTNDYLAKWIRKDFPAYQIDASVIKNIKTHRRINEALKLYDSVVLPMRINEDLDFLAKIEAKDRITLFANAGCALTCPSKLCYPSFSKFNKGEGNQIQCSRPVKERNELGMVDFPLQLFINLGFHRFKLLRTRPEGMTGY